MNSTNKDSFRMISFNNIKTLLCELIKIASTCFILILACSRDWKNPVIDPPPPEGLVAYFPFNGNANDESENSNHGVVFGATLTLDRFGNPNSAYSFDGINDVIMVADHASLRSQNMTITVWVNPISFPNFATIFMKSSVDNWDDGFGLANYNVGNEINFFVNHWDNAKVSGTIETGKWTFLACLVDSSNITLYRDNRLIHSVLFSSQISHSTVPLLIGKGASDRGFNYQWKGKIDDIRIYNCALNEEELLLLYHENGWDE